MGVNTALYKSLTFGVSAAYTGVAGALSAVTIAYVAPDSFDVFRSITFLVGIVIGGLASVSGAIFGALFIQFVPNWAHGHLQGGAVGDLRRLPDRLHVRDAPRYRRHHTPGRRPLAASTRGTPGVIRGFPDVRLVPPKFHPGIDASRRTR